MALKGNLKDFSITQLLNLINLARKTGALIINGSEQNALVNFQKGKLAYSEFSDRENSIGAVLYKTRIISRGQYGTLRKRAPEMSDKELGILLISSGYVSQEDIIASLQKHYVNTVQELFSWSDGNFYFDNDKQVPSDRIPVKVDLENIIMEGSRRIQENAQLEEELPNLDLSLKFTDRPGVNIKNVNLSVDEWKVVSYINPKNSMKQIARVTKMTDLQIRKIVLGLLQAGLVELVRSEKLDVLPKVSEALGQSDKQEQKNIINRIISRIRSL